MLRNFDFSFSFGQFFAKMKCATLATLFCLCAEYKPTINLFDPFRTSACIRRVSIVVLFILLFSIEKILLVFDRSTDVKNNIVLLRVVINVLVKHLL